MATELGEQFAFHEMRVVEKAEQAVDDGRGSMKVDGADDATGELFLDETCGSRRAQFAVEQRYFAQIAARTGQSETVAGRIGSGQASAVVEQETNEVELQAAVLAGDQRMQRTLAQLVALVNVGVEVEEEASVGQLRVSACDNQRRIAINRLAVHRGAMFEQLVNDGRVVPFACDMQRILVGVHRLVKQLDDKRLVLSLYGSLKQRLWFQFLFAVQQTNDMKI